MAIEFRDCPNHGLQKIVRTEFKSDIIGGNTQTLACGETFPFEPPLGPGEPATPVAKNEDTPNATTAQQRIENAAGFERQGLQGVRPTAQTASAEGERGTASDTIDRVRGVQDAAELDRMAAAEQSHPDGARKTVLDAIERQRTALEEK